ncbi:toll-like receptor 2 type-2 [Polyodon spathula]|uniref:toll-like receptor 2 type-2 n=1 Tax=Polyodon spathula TaxID=7913 RepID=UPI001B7F508F|nr:toll-like receptor 2 type-2 [Polyodon spathula]
MFLGNHVVVGLCLIFCETCISAAGEHVANCSAQNYPTAPCAFPSDTMTLDLSHNSMETILRRDFSGVRGLRKLYLQFNQISSVDPEAFQDNLELEYLDVSNNKIRDISALPFRNLPALNHLDITNNIDTDIILGPQFSSLQNLQTLKLGNPQISSLRENSFQKLVGLPLKEFHLITGDFTEYEHSLKPLDGLEKITLEVNMWQNLELFISMFKDIVNSTKTLEVKNLDFARREKFIFLDFFLETSQLISLAFYNISSTGNYSSFLLNSVVRSKIEVLTLDNVKLNVGDWRVQISPQQQMHLRSWFVKNTVNLNSIENPESMINIYRSLVHIALVNCKVYFIPCILLESMALVESADLSSNFFREYSLFPPCLRPFPSLRSLVINNNKFEDLQKLSIRTSNLKQLVNMSASYNTISVRSSEACLWTESLRILNLKGNVLQSNVFDCLPASLEILDLSLNNITVVSNIEKMRNLKELYLTGNQIFSLRLSPLPTLRVLHADENKISHVTTSMLKDLTLAELTLSKNPFECDCDIQDTAYYFQSMQAKVIDWPEKYRCLLPNSLRGAEIRHVSISGAQCNLGVISGVLIACILLAAILSVFLCRKYNKDMSIRTRARRVYRQISICNQTQPEMPLENM